jgi:hypothetical protein
MGGLHQYIQVKKKHYKRHIIIANWGYSFNIGLQKSLGAKLYKLYMAQWLLRLLGAFLR